MSAARHMTKDEMVQGFNEGRTLIQEEWSDPGEIKDIDDLIASGYCTATPWEYKDGFQCERRRVTGIKGGPTSK
jgi:hypothetical protein